MDFRIIIKNHSADPERFLRLRQTISEKIRDYHKGGSNSRILAVQLSDLTTTPTVPVWNRELHLLKI